MNDKYEPCSICEEYIEGVICDNDKCPVGRMKKEIKTARAEAVKEFAKMVKKEIKYFVVNPRDLNEVIDNLVAEMAGEENA